MPFVSSKSMIAAWCVGRSVLPGKSVTSLQPRTPEASGRGRQPRPGRGQVGGHRAEQAGVARERGDPRRQRDGPGGELGVGAREGVEQLVEVEQLFHVGAAEHNHRKGRYPSGGAARLTCAPPTEPEERAAASR